MRWQGRRRSTNVEDRRGQQVSGAGAGSGAGAIGQLLFTLLLRGNAKTRLFVLAAILVGVFVFRITPQALLSGDGSAPTTTQVSPAPDDEMRAFLETLKADNEDVWTAIFRSRGLTYEPARMVIYYDRTMMPGGVADARTGPFYLPTDDTVYIDPHFFEELRTRFGAPGDFAQAYVVAHEIGHHVQNLLGYTERLHGQQGRVSDAEYNQLSVRLELQADFFAGVFAKHSAEQFGSLEPGDIEEAMRCAEAIGDDTLQRGAGHRVVPDSFTHGTSEQRVRWFVKGYRTGDIDDGDTFSVGYGEL